MAVLTQLRGELEPCGCSGTLVGSLDRVAGALQELRQNDRPLLLVVAGDVLGTPDQGGASLQRARKEALFDRLLTRLGPDVLLVEPDALDDARLARVARASHAQVLAFPAAEGESARFIPSQGARPSVALVAADATAATAVARARAQGAGLVIAVDADGGPEPAGLTPDLWIHLRSTVIEGTTRQKEKHVRLGSGPTELRIVEVALGEGPPRVVAAHDVALDEHAPSDPSVRAQLDQLFASLADSSASIAPSEPPAPDGPSYVGSRTCAACHVAIYHWWRATPHGRALRTLEARGRAHDLACIGCHVTGFGQPGGTQGAPFGELGAVGCESCHGPGSVHADDPTQPPAAISTPLSSTACTGCHDAEHAPGFDFNRDRLRLDAASHPVRRQAH